MKKLPGPVKLALVAADGTIVELATLPEWARFVAQDRNGSACAFEGRPVADKRAAEWLQCAYEADVDEFDLMVLIAPFTTLNDWTSRLYEITPPAESNG